MGGWSGSTITSDVEVFETNTNKPIPTQEETKSMKNCSHLQKVLTNDANGKAMNDSNDDVQSATQYDVFTHPSTCKTDSTTSSVMTVHQRVLCMEESVGLKHDPSAVLIRRIEFLETNIFGEIQDSGKALTERVDYLEVSFFGKKK